MTYFKTCNTLDEAKNHFKQLCKDLHPDTSGYDSQSDFVKMMLEFKTVSKILKQSSKHASDKNFDSEKFYNTVKLFDGLENIKISFVGSFIWLEDLTPSAMYHQKDLIKSIKIDGYNYARWAKNKKSWYYSPVDYKRKGGSRKSLEEIKTSYGSQSFKTTTKQRLTA